MTKSQVNRLSCTIISSKGNKKKAKQRAFSQTNSQTNMEDTPENAIIKRNRHKYKHLKQAFSRANMKDTSGENVIKRYVFNSDNDSDSDNDEFYRDLKLNVKSISKILFFRILKGTLTTINIMVLLNEIGNNNGIKILVDLWIHEHDNEWSGNLFITQKVDTYTKILTYREARRSSNGTINRQLARPNIKCVESGARMGNVEFRELMSYVIKYDSMMTDRALQLFEILLKIHNVQNYDAMSNLRNLNSSNIEEIEF